MPQDYTVSEQQLAAYLQTDYSFNAGACTIVIRLDAANADLLSFLHQEQITSWAYLTAWNPYSNAQSADFNQKQQQLLLNRLKEHKVYKGEGKGRDGIWPGEESYFVVGISRDKACKIGLDFNQTAILVSSESLEPELVILYPSTAQIS